MRGFSQIIILIVFGFIGLGVMGVGGYVVVDTLVDNRVAQIENNLLMQEREDRSEAPLNLKKDEVSKEVQEKTTPSVVAQQKNVEVGSEAKPEIKTFTTPNGAVIDEAGNIISPPTKTTSQISNNIIAGVTTLSGEEIYSLVSPSVVSITSSSGSGSGFIVSGGKYIITNKHVVNNDKTVTVKFHNGATVSGPVLGTNSDWDVALIFNHQQSLKPVTLGSSEPDKLRVGSDIYVLGFPLSSQVIVFTKGVVSANKQKVEGRDYIQTDATTHPGNSGGPVVNNRGEVVGLHRLGTGGTGIALSVPVEIVTTLIPSLSQYGRSRFELYPVGSSISMKHSQIYQMTLNDDLSCTRLGYTDEELTLCDLYRNHYQDYSWNIIKDL